MKSRFLTVLGALLLTLLARPVFAAGLVIAWNANDDTDLAGYIVRYGTQPHDYRTRVDVGLATTFTADDLVAGQTYYFTVQAYDSTGAVSGLATELPAVVVGAARDTATAHLLTPRDGQRDVTSAETFTWAAVPQADAYRLQVGTTLGGGDVIDSGVTKRTTWTTATLPADVTLFARLRTKVGATWTTSDVQFTTAPTSRLIYPYAAASDVSANETLSWSGITGATAYRVRVGTTPGGTDIADSGETRATTFAVRNLQPGQTLYADVSTLRAEVWTVDAVTFTTALTARLSGAADGGDLGQGLAWKTILGATAYRVRLGTTADAADLFDSGDTLGTTVETPALPAGQPIVARVSTSLGGEWRERTTTLTLAGAALTLADAAMVRSVGQVFHWTTISNAEAYLVTVGTEAGAKDVVSSGELQTTSFQAATLPSARLFVTVWTKANGVWNGTASTVVVK